MILKIRARNIGIIPFVDVDLKPGLNVITGETGAGKTLFTRALLACFGFQSLSELQRNSEAETFVEVVLENPENESGYSVIRKELKNGRTFSYLDDRLASNEKLRSIFENKIVVLAQHSSIALLKKDRQRAVLDAFDGSLSDTYLNFKQAFNRLKEIKGQLEKLISEKEDFERQHEIMKFQLKELQEAGLKEDEDTELEEYVRRVRNRAKIAESVYRALELLKDGEENIIGNLGEACSEIEKVRSYDSKAQNILEQMYAVQSQLEDIALELKTVLDIQDVSLEELERAESRLFRIQELKRKYGQDLQGLIALKEELESRLSQFGSFEDAIERLKREIKSLEKEVSELAEELSKKRSTAAEQLQALVNNVLNELNMKTVEFRINLQAVPTGPHGNEEVIFEIRNRGTSFSPIDSSISGGELSRLLLAIESSTNDTVDVFVFDEVDAGIGGDTALQVGRYLRKLAEKSQVIVVTHLPQIAAFAFNHILVQKRETDGVVTARFRVLENDDIIKEIARMLSGSAVRDKAEEHARNLIEYARSSLT